MELKLKPYEVIQCRTEEESRLLDAMCVVHHWRSRRRSYDWCESVWKIHGPITVYCLHTEKYGPMIAFQTRHATVITFKQFRERYYVPFYKRILRKIFKIK